MSKSFGIIGVAGFIAPRHLQAIKQNACDLRCAMDLRDCVGILDSYFPQADFFIESERFDRYLDKLKRNHTPLDYISICSPNYLHDSHIRLALRNQSNAICEKPIVLNPWNLDALESLEEETQKHIYTILQLRLHPSIIALKKQIEQDSQNNPHQIYEIDLSYITARGKWYHISWKGDESKSGGIATNIGIHFFDMLIWIFGTPKVSIVHYIDEKSASGYLELASAKIRWFLSIDENLLPPSLRENEKKRVFRSLTLNQQEFNFSEGFTDLHTKSYEEILSGKGFRCSESRAVIELVHQIRNATPIGLKGEYHPFNLRLDL